MIRGFVILLLVLALSGCNSAAQPNKLPNDESANLLVVVQGAVNVKRAGRSEYVPGMFGMVLHRGDLLQISTGALAKVACADLTLVDAATGTAGVPCNSSKAVISDPASGSRVSTARSSTAVDIPIVISPRRTKLLDLHPVLRWTSLPGVSTYSVSIQARDVVWSTEVKGATEIKYPNSAPDLAPGVTYKLVVVADGRSSENKLVPDLGFTVSSPDEIAETRAAETRIAALGLADGPTQFLTAVLRATRQAETRDNFNAEAIEQLESLAGTFKQPAVLRMLGDLYLKIGLVSMAAERYQQAELLSVSVNDTEGQATALQTLGTINVMLGNKDDAARRLQDAIGLYQKIGDAATVQQLQEELNKLKNP